LAHGVVDFNYNSCNAAGGRRVVVVCFKKRCRYDAVGVCVCDVLAGADRAEEEARPDAIKEMPMLVHHSGASKEWNFDRHAPTVAATDMTRFTVRARTLHQRREV
jgi:hypothetical protein